MKKIIIFIGVIVVLFGALALVNNITNSKKAEGNPFNKSTLHPETIKQLDDPNYQNIILPNELEERLANGEDVTVYFYSPTCPACKQASPLINSAAGEVGAEVVLYNLLEFEEGWSVYGISVTPTLIRFEAGSEVNRVEGLPQVEGLEEMEDAYKQWIQQFN